MKMRLPCFFVGLALAVHLHAASDVTISASSTSGGAFSGGNPNVFTPTAAAAIENNGTIETALNGGDAVTVNTASASGVSGDLTVSASISKTAGSTSTLTLNAVRDLAINAALSASTGSMPLMFTAGRAISSTAPIASNDGTITINTVQPFTLGSSLNAGTGHIVFQTGSLESSSYQYVTASTVQVAAGAAWKQIGAITGDLSVAGTLSPGAAAGSLVVNGSLALQSTATVSMDLV